MIFSQSLQYTGICWRYCKCHLLRDTIKTEGKPLPEPKPDHEIFDNSDPIYEFDFAKIQKWDSEIFIKSSLRMMNNWDINELNYFLTVLSSELKRRKPEIEKIFFKEFYLPKFTSLTNVLIADQWRGINN
jgi:hypothetical protein